MRKYRCPIYMGHSEALLAKWRDQGLPYPQMTSNDVDVRLTLTGCAAELEAALRKDQHQLYHDGEFADGCDICDQERIDYA